ncbi:MAG: hypothetical protein K8J08_10655 [Thermoanaerobaculia bacterium]|nr:hypothetical protein [Thermoanaerobaculia bacterium]
MKTTLRSIPTEEWLPPGKTGAICFSIDDIHPATSKHLYEAGGDLGEGVLGHVEWLLERHPQLHTTLFVTPAWRMTRGRSSRPWLAKLPLLARHCYLDRIQPRGALRLDRHPQFCRFLGELPRTELALHGLHHVRRGDPVHVEFLGRNRRSCRRALSRGLALFRRAGLIHAGGLQPPGWELSSELAAAAARVGLQWVSSARDLETPISREALSAGSGLRGAPLIQPSWLRPSDLVHFSTNFQATCQRERALEILDSGGLLSVKAHAVKNVGGHVMADGLDRAYRDQLDQLFSDLDRRYGDHLHWTTFGALAERLRSGRPR